MNEEMLALDVEKGHVRVNRKFNQALVERKCRSWEFPSVFADITNVNQKISLENGVARNPLCC